MNSKISCHSGLYPSTSLLLDWCSDQLRYGTALIVNMYIGKLYPYLYQYTLRHFVR